MPAEKAQALVLRTTDWSETSRIATLWTREFGKVRTLAKGGRRLKSNFESALDLLTHCRIVFIRKSPGSLDLLTEAQVVRRFPRLRSDLAALHGAYYVAELLEAMTEEHDPHPALFDAALDALDYLGSPAPTRGVVGDHAPTQEGGPPAVGPAVARFELVLLQEVGYSPALEGCATCGGPVDARRPFFSCAAGGLVCRNCAAGSRDRRPLSPAAREMMRALQPPPSPPTPLPRGERGEEETPLPRAEREEKEGTPLPSGGRAEKEGTPLPAGERGRGEGEPRDDARDRPWDAGARAEVRQVLGQYVTYLLGRRPRLLPYLGS